MSSAELMRGLIEVSVAMSAAIALVLALRRPMRHWLGADVAYASWLIVPLTTIAVMLPAAAEPSMPMRWSAIAASPAAFDQALSRAGDETLWLWFGLIWAVGALAMSLRTIAQQRRFERGLGRLHRREDGLYQACGDNGLPAAFGLIRPKIVVPGDFDRRFDPEQRALIVMHERTHIARGDLLINALVAAGTCLCWFNPLLHYALRHFRADQELACDLQVLRRRPNARRSYAEAMFKSALRGGPLPLACSWASAHPITERIVMLNKPLPALARTRLGVVVLVLIGSAAAVGAWAAQPPTASADRLVTVRTLPGSITAREMAIQAATQAGLVLVNPEVLDNSRKNIGASLTSVEARMIFGIVEDESGMRVQYDGDRVKFIPDTRPRRHR